MIQLRAAVLTVAVLASAALGFAQTADAPPATPISLAAYLDRLDRLGAAVEHLDAANARSINDVTSALPHLWRVNAGGETWPIATDGFSREFADWRGRPSPEGIARMRAWVAVARAHAAAFDAPSAPAPGARKTLDDILSRREFAGVRGPSWIQRLRDRIREWIVTQLERLFGWSSLPTITRGFVYFVLAIACALAAWTALRFLSRQRRDRPMPLTLPDVRPPRPWVEWLEEAQLAAGRSDWRDAVRFAYWTGITFLENRGTWRPDPSRTPREYVALAGREHGPTLRSLTSIFEHVWYAADEADAKRFEAALDCLRTLGCPLG